MSVNFLEVSGYRGFATPQTLKFAKPDCQNEGSGLTFLLGANNSGKSAFLEALKFFAGNGEADFSGSQRNVKTSQRVTIKLNYLEDLTAILETVPQGGSPAHLDWGDTNNRPRIFYLPSRRFFRHEFSKGYSSREEVMHNLAQKERDNAALDYFSSRLFDLTRDQGRLNSYNELLAKILGYDLKWILEKEGNHFIQYEIDSISHKSEGVGDGIINLMIIAEAIHNASSIDTIIIDEPEVSLHPSAQKQLYVALKELSKTTQIILATHSQYFIDFEAIAEGAQAARFYKKGDEIRIAELPTDSRAKIRSFLDNARNPHVLGANAKEIFFVGDRVLLVEGQDDVMCLERASKQLALPINGNIFGWGVGGETNMPFFAGLLRDLGYKKVVGLLDHNATVFADLVKDFPEFTFMKLSTDDIRDKPAENAKSAKTGLFTSGCKLKTTSMTEIRGVLETINSSF